MHMRSLTVMVLAAQVRNSAAQEAGFRQVPVGEAVGQNLVVTPALITSSTNIPFFAAGVCATHISCENLGIATVTTVTESVPGLIPIATPLTITPTCVKPGYTHTVIIVPTGTHVTRETHTITMLPGETYFPDASNTEINGPVIEVVYPGGPDPTKTHTKTSTLTSGHSPSEITVINEPPLVGVDPTVTIIPTVTSGIEVTVCPPEKIVTVTSQPIPGPTVTTTAAGGTVVEKPASKFPCSKDDDKPCRGAQVQGWTVFKTLFDAKHKYDGNTYPGPWTRTLDLDEDTILTVTDSWYQAEHWTVSLDGQVIGETHEDGFQNEKLSCTTDGDSCIAKGFSHGSFMLPKGKHTLSIEWTDGPLKFNNGYSWWTHGYGVYRLDKPCRCGNSEL
ncbi:hypothetical protein GMORB2_3776 [Geosmithia morbida]|uniref:Uncharacterized protein n=1 Tax=Geosmithia morbida TaxID=1094350 RepID=A0A9P5D3H0_9HYPO|nr:uncharacterized protein GMORB2_3776 [Geosmithia morbida]KAF4124937.1 hypothetical protein GMORB2_3776 [Geosmithia morbida]